MPAQSPPAQLTANLWMLGTLAYPVYLFHDDGEAALFEGSIGAHISLLCKQIEEASVRRETIKQLVITHAHPDHVMAVPGLREVLPGLTVAASAAAAETLAAPKAVAMFVQLDALLTESLRSSGAVAPDACSPPAAIEQIPVDRVLQEGDRILVGRCGFQVLQTPGHSDCSLSFYEPSQGILLVSDATGYFVPEDRSWWPCYFAGYNSYLGSIERLAALDAQLLCLSHNGVVRGPAEIRAYFKDALAATRAYHARIVRETKAGTPGRRLAEELGREIYEKAPVLPLEFFQKNCSGLVKQSLKHEGL